MQVVKYDNNFRTSDVENSHKQKTFLKISLSNLYAMWFTITIKSFIFGTWD